MKISASQKLETRLLSRLTLEQAHEAVNLIMIKTKRGLLEEILKRLSVESTTDEDGLSIEYRTSLHIYSTEQITEITKLLRSLHETAWGNGERGIAALIGDSLELLTRNEL